MNNNDLIRRWRATSGRGRKLRGLIVLLAPYKARVALMFVALIIATAAALAPPPLAALAIDKGIVPGDMTDADSLRRATDGVETIVHLVAIRQGSSEQFEREWETTEQVHANAAASGVELTPDTLAAIDEALGDAPVREPTLAPFAKTGITHRS